MNQIVALEAPSDFTILLLLPRGGTQSHTEALEKFPKKECK
jgi:hypothetical protein